MTNSRSKSEVLSKTCKTYLQELAIEEMYGIRKEFSSRYTDKGNLVEDESISLAQEVLDFGLMYKNEEHFNNDYLSLYNLNKPLSYQCQESISSDSFASNKYSASFLEI